MGWEMNEKEAADAAAIDVTVCALMYKGRNHHPLVVYYATPYL